MRLTELMTFTIPSSWFSAASFSTMDQRQLMALRKAVDAEGVDENDLDAVRQIWATMRQKNITQKPVAVRDGKSSRR